MPKVSEEDYLAHYGILRRSGRYPWGSGANSATSAQRSKSFLDITEDLKKNHGMDDKTIAKMFSTDDHPFTTTHLRALRTISTTIQKQEQLHEIQKLADKGMGNSAIARQMGLNESTVRSLREVGRQEKLNELQAISDMLKREVDEKGMIDVGSQVHRDLPIGDNPNVRIGVAPDKFKTALIMLEEEGYPTHGMSVPQAGTGEFTKMRVLCPPGTTRTEAFVNRHSIQQITRKSEDGGKTFSKDLSIVPPLSISSKRVGIKYAEDGGADADGVIYVRPGVPDLSMGKARYAQVRIAVDNSHYLKGMAVYKDDLPDGIDLLFNTNKSNTGNKHDAMKPYKKDPEGKVDPVNPYGAAIKIGGQIKGPNGKAISAMNRIYDEGDWDTWSKTLSRQVLSKQSPELAKSQLDLTHDRRRDELEKIKGLTNPLVRQKLLEAFSDETDKAAVHLKAAHMPRQATKVLMPVKSVKPTEIYAPTFPDGMRVALVRFPHAGTFEIPELTVNNKNREARKLFGVGKGGTAPDVVGIHPKVAERLSGADFDGDHVVVIPNDRGHIKSAPALERLKGFDPKGYHVPYGPPTKQYPKGTPVITDSKKQNEMGNITNLIADMTIKGASNDEKARAVRHSMVVIDSEKHNLDIKWSERDHGILNLKRKYQGTTPTGQLKGASTLITRATAQKHIDRRKAANPAIDPKTGRKMFIDTGEHNVKYKEAGKTRVKNFRSKEEADAFVRENKIANAKVEPRTFKTKRLAVEDDAFSLVSEGRGTRMEEVYADHSNRLKAMGNEARKEMVNTKLTPYSPSAAKVYANEVQSLKVQVDRALRNAPRERQAQVLTDMMVRQRKQANPGMDKDTEKKIRSLALIEARLRTDAKKDRIDITPREWEAIQAGAVSKTLLSDILRHTDTKVIRELATPRKNPVMTTTLTNRAKAMLNSGIPLADVADALGVSLSTLKSSVAREGGE